jgi:cytochrome c peroxidase
MRAGRIALTLAALCTTAVPARAGADALRDQAKQLFGTPPPEAVNPANPSSPAKIDLGRKLYYDARLSKNHDVSCNSCHQLDKFGVDNEPTSPGHKGQRGGRNSPTSLNAAFHLAQFWDGRAADVEEQAKGPILNPVEMAMPDEASVVAVLLSIPGYPPLFAQAFPGEDPALTYDNMAKAIASFERRLVTPAPFDAYLAGDDGALSQDQKKGLETFIATGCPTCHNGPLLGGSLYQKLGLVEPYPIGDRGRAEVTGSKSDEYFFKVPSLRNIAKTGPWLHDGSVDSLDLMVRVMARFQLGKTLTDDEAQAISDFLQSLTGKVDEKYVAQPELPPSGPDTPPPDPS